MWHVSSTKNRLKMHFQLTKIFCGKTNENLDAFCTLCDVPNPKTNDLRAQQLLIYIFDILKTPHRDVPKGAFLEPSRKTATSHTKM